MGSKEFAISPIGISLFLLALVLGASWNRRRFIGWTFFFAPLLDLPVMWVKGSHVTPFHALILGWSVAGLWRAGNLSRILRFSRSEIALLFWLATVWLSLLMPVLFKDAVNVVTIHTPYIHYGDKVPLRFTLTNITQAMYPTFMVWAVLITRRAFRSESDLTCALNSLLRGVTVVFISGLLIQAGLYFGGAHLIHAVTPPVYGVDYTSEIMARIAKYDAFGRFPRMYSLAGEPSYTANIFATVLALASSMVLTTYGTGSTAPHRLRSFVTLSMLIFGLLLSGSTSGYLGFALVLGVVFMVAARFKLYSGLGTLIVVLAVNLLAITLLAIYAASHLAHFSPLHYLISKQVEKVTELHGSGAIRMKTILYSLKLFFALPLLGVGYGSHRSGALITALLSNIGVIGTLAFVAAMCFYVVECLQNVRRASSNYLASIARSGGAALILWLILSAVSDSLSGLLFPWFWLLLALIGACSSVRANSTVFRPLVQPEITGSNVT